MNIIDKYSLEDLPVGVCLLSRENRSLEVFYLNPEMAVILDIGRPVPAPELSFETLFPGDDAKELFRQLRSTTPPQTYVLALEQGDENSAGRAHWLKLSITEESYDGRNVFVLWATDISASKQAEKQLEAAIAEADASAQMKANFLATMSHEIRTPMQSVYGLLELIAEEKPAPDIAQMIEIARNSSAGLLEILDDILDFAKIDAHKMDLDMFEVPLRTLVYGTLEALSVKVRGKEVALAHDIAQDVPFVVIGDPKRLRQILINLTGNALKFTEKGSVTISVSREIRHIPAPSHGLGIRFEIRDTGIGMSAETCAKLFQPFTQADSSTSRKFGGTGLGLSICKKLVELMGGQIGVDSEDGKGSVFWFEIPTEEVSTEANTVDLPSLDGISVLSVEDHPQGAKEIIKSLQSMGATVESCPTYQEGLDLARRRPFDVGIIDQGLPDGLGIDLIREIVEIRPYMGMIMYTVRDDPGLQHSLNAMGISFLPKPASRLGLGVAVQEAARKNVVTTFSGPSKLLIAEDTESVADVLRRQLSRLGVEADFVENGRQALNALQTGAYGILFTDLHMPDMDGYAVVEAIRKQEAETPPDTPFPVIVLTADVQMSQRHVYMDHGFDECLLKPVSLGRFRRLLIRWGLLGENEGGEPEQQKSDSSSHLELFAVDLSAMQEMMGIGPDAAGEMIGLFVDMTASQIKEISKASAACDYAKLHELAHSLKGAARSACCPVLGDLAADLQNAAEKEEPSCASLATRVVSAFEDVRKDLEVLNAFDQHQQPEASSDPD